MNKAEFISALRNLAAEIAERDSIQYYNVGGSEARLFDKDGVYGRGIRVEVIEGNA